MILAKHESTVLWSCPQAARQQHMPHSPVMSGHPAASDSRLRRNLGNQTKVPKHSTHMIRPHGVEVDNGVCSSRGETGIVSGSVRWPTGGQVLHPITIATPDVGTPDSVVTIDHRSPLSFPQLRATPHYFRWWDPSCHMMK